MRRGFQHVAGNRQFVGRRSDIGASVVKDQVFEMHEFAIDPLRGEVGALEEAGADCRAGNALIQASDSGRGVEIGRNRPCDVQLG
ncbi:hypothetical protein EV128_10448 [Rhizobium azibense]|nr:hypothetical protein EV128_10448 [Rhizobium azibense]